MARTLLAIYPHSPHRYDEMLSADGGVRPHWQQFFDHLDAVAPDEMRERLEFVDRRILENGVTYNVYAAPDGADRPWALDPVPLIIPPEDWAAAMELSARAFFDEPFVHEIFGSDPLTRYAGIHALYASATPHPDDFVGRLGCERDDAGGDGQRPGEGFDEGGEGGHVGHPGRDGER